MYRRAKRALFMIGLVVVVCFTFCVGQVKSESATSTLPPIFIYDSYNHLLEISIEDVGKYHGHVCPCMMIAYRAIQSAFVKLWKDEIPYRYDIKIVSRSPTQGTQDVFEFITRAKTRLNRKGDFRIELPEGTSTGNIKPCNFVYAFLRKSTGDILEVQVKESVFPEGFFQMKKKLKSGKFTSNNRKMLEKAIGELKNKILNLSAEELFIFKEASSQLMDEGLSKLMDEQN